jgi:HEPN domain-containing protein
MKKKKNNQINLRKLATEWFLKAKDDELSAKDILTDKEGAPSTVCFLSQQMVEKYLKGYLIFKGKRFPKIHDLDRLVRLCQKIDSNFEKIKGGARYLSDFYIAARYPGDYSEFSWTEAEKAFQAATRIKKFVLKKIK